MKSLISFHYYNYYSNYSISLPIPLEIQTIYSKLGKDYIGFEIWKYDSKKIEKLKSKKYVKPMDIDIVKSIFEQEIKKYYSSEIIESSFDENKLLSNENYYAYITKRPYTIPNGMIKYKAELFLVIDITSKNIYVFEIH